MQESRFINGSGKMISLVIKESVRFFQADHHLLSLAHRR